MVVRVESAKPEQTTDATARLLPVDPALPKRYVSIVRAIAHDAVALTLAALGAMLGAAYGHQASPPPLPPVLASTCGQSL